MAKTPQKPSGPPADAVTQMERILESLPRVVRDGGLAAPNVALRSALFAGANSLGKRGLRRETLASLSNITLIYTGMRLDQGDLDCWMAIMQAAHEGELDGYGRFLVSGYRLLQIMGLKNTGPNQDLLDARLSKLKSGAIDIKTGRFSYEGSLIDEVYRDEETRQFVVKLNPKMTILFAPESGWTRLDLAVRSRLGRNQLAKWLHAFIASHKQPLPIGAEKIKKLCASDITEMWRFRQELKKAIGLVNAVTGWKLELDSKTYLLSGYPIRSSNRSSDGCSDDQ